MTAPKPAPPILWFVVRRESAGSEWQRIRTASRATVSYHHDAFAGNAMSLAILLATGCDASNYGIQNDTTGRVIPCQEGK